MIEVNGAGCGRAGVVVAGMRARAGAAAALPLGALVRQSVTWEPAMLPSPMWTRNGLQWWGASPEMWLELRNPLGRGGGAPGDGALDWHYQTRFGNDLKEDRKLLLQMFAGDVNLV